MSAPATPSNPARPGPGGHETPTAGDSPPEVVRKKVTVPQVAAAKGERKLTMVTAYDHPSAVIVSEAGVDMILVGDSVANAVHGFDTTLHIDVDTMVLHTAAVARAQPHCLVVGDMPWMSYHVTAEDAVTNAARLVRAGAEAVKLEGGRKRVPVIERILDAEIPVMGHIGLTPQSVHAMGGFKVQGRELEAARKIIEDAKALDAAGVFSIVLEGIPDVVADIITTEVSVPTIGIGAGPGTDGQVLVFHDVLGLGSGRYPKFVRPYADLHTQAVQALANYVSDVSDGSFPADAESYHMKDEAAAAFLDEVAASGDLFHFSS